MKKQILSLGKDSAIYGASSIVTRFISLFMLPLFTAYLKPEEYGVLAMLALLTMMAQPVFSLGLSAGMGPIYFERDSLLNKSEVVWSVFLINIVSAILLVTIAWLFQAPLGELVRLPTEYLPLIGLTLTGCALTILVTSFTQRVQFEKQALLYTFATLASTLIAILVSVITVVFFGLGVKGMVYGQLAGNVSIFFIFMLIGLKTTTPSISFFALRESLRQGLPLVPSFAFLFILMHANRYILEWHAGLNAVGVYSVGFSIGMVISIVTSGIATAWYPFFMTYMKRQKEAKVIFGRIFTYYIFGVGFITLCFFLVAKPVILLLTQSAFHDAYIVIGFVALAYFAQTIFNFFLPGIYFRKEIKYVSVVQGLAAFISLPINFFLITSFGVLGAAIGLCVSNFLMAVMMYGWNFLNSDRYLIVSYEWDRVFTFALCALVILVFYLQISVTTTKGEITKSILMVGLTLLTILLLLNKRERIVVIKKVLGK